MGPREAIFLFWCKPFWCFQQIPGSAMSSSSQTLVEQATDSSQKLWAQLSSAGTLADYARAWLALQCSFVPRAAVGLVVVRADETAAYEPVAQWPPATEDARHLAEICERALREASGLLTEVEAPQSSAGVDMPHYAMAYPVTVGKRLHGVAAVVLAAHEQDEVRAAMAQLQWGIGWLELWFLRRQTESDAGRLDGQQATIDLMAAVLAEERADAACMAFVTELANRYALGRASVGFVEHETVEVRAVSHSAAVGNRMNLNRALGAAMEESVVQRRSIVYPEPADRDVLVTREHEELSRQQGVEAVLTIPLFGDGRYYAALTLERSGESGFDEREAEFFAAVAGLAGPVLESKRLRDRPFPYRARDGVREQAARLVGPERVGLKVLAVVAVLVLAYLSFAKADYRLSADVALEGAVQRALVAPFDGYVDEAPARPGDVVEEGDLLCRLDDRDLSLERLKWTSQRSGLQRRLQEALAGYDRVEVSIMSAQLDQLQAQLELTESHLARTEVRAPFDGVVVSGDLSQRLGGAVQKGEALYQVTPLDAYRVVLKIPENRISDLRVGQQGSLVLASLPQQGFGFSVRRITPISMAEEGQNHYRVEADLDEVVDALRPGMEGVGKIQVDRRRILSIWTRHVREWIDLKLWAWWG